MSHRIGLAKLALVLGVALGLALRGASAIEPKKPGRQSLNELSMEAAALQTLHFLKATPEQMGKLRDMAADTLEKPSSRMAPKGSDKLRKLLIDVRNALIEDMDSARIDDLLKQLDDLRTSEKPELDDAIEITDEARARAPEVVELFTAGQVAGFIGAYADGIPDPQQVLLGELSKVRGLQDEEWKEARKAAAEEISQMLGGSDPDQVEEVGNKVVQLLIVARSMKDDEFKKQLPELEKMAHDIVGNAGPIELLRNFVEHNIAELLSNPQLPAAIDAHAK